MFLHPLYSAKDREEKTHETTHLHSLEASSLTDGCQ
jgi:hypothetical protein